MDASTTQTIINQISTAFAPVAQKIGEGAQYGWDIVLRQQLITGIESGIAFILCIMILIAEIIFLFKARKNGLKYEKESFYDENPWYVAMVISSIAVFLLEMFALPDFFDTAVTHLLNPAYYAIDFFIHLVN